MTAHKKMKKRGFTLIEILVATAIMVVMTGMVIQITSQVLNVWNRSSGRLSANAQARIAMELLTNDLETAVLRNNGQQWLRVEGGSDGVADVVNTAPYKSKTVALKLFSPAMDRNTELPGDLCGIAYRLEYQGSYDGANAPNVYALYRKREDPEATFKALLDTRSAADSEQDELIGSKGSAMTSDLWVKNEILDDSNFLASNIIDFQVLVYGLNAAGDSVELLTTEDADGLIETYAFGGSGGSTKVPLYAEITLRVISDEADALLASGQIAQTGLSVEEYVNANSETYTRRVELMTRPF